MRKPKSKSVGPRLRIKLTSQVTMGPGKADLLEGIQETGSIAAAGRRMGMSYKRAWYLVDGMNHDFKTPLVESAIGGARGGGAILTAFGREVLSRYRSMERLAAQAIASDLRDLRSKLAKTDKDV